MDGKRLFEYGGHWLIRRGDTPKLYIYWCQPGTRRVLRRSTGTSDVEEAKRELILFAESSNAYEAKVRLRSADNHVPRGSKRAVVDLLCDYVESLHGKPSATTARYALAVWSSYVAKADLVFADELTPAKQAEFVAWCRARKLNTGRVMSNGTINRYLDILRSALKLAQRNGSIAAVPVLRLLPKPPPRDRFLCDAEVARLLAACEHEHLRRFVTLSLCTLQRCSAVLGLRVEQIDLTWNRINFLPPHGTQSNKRRPTIPIATALKPILEKWVSESRSGYIIEHDGQPIKRIRRAFAAACERANLAGVTPGVLRHTGATLLAAAGVPIREISGMLGHTTSRITEEVYAKRRPEFLSQAIVAIDNLFGDSIIEQENKAQSARQCAPNARQLEKSDAKHSASASTTLVLDAPLQPAACLHFSVSYAIA